MNPDRIVAGLDIGSAKTTAVIGEVVGELPKHPLVKILGVGQARTTGIRRGVVADIEGSARAIRKAGQGAERMGGGQVTEVYSGSEGEHVQAVRREGGVEGRRDELARSHVCRGDGGGRAQAVPGEREQVQARPQEYSV